MKTLCLYANGAPKKKGTGFLIESVLQKAVSDLIAVGELP